MIRKPAKTVHIQLPTAILIGSCIIGIAIIINGIFLYMTVQSETTTPKKTYENIGYVKIDKSPLLGNKNAPITVIEYTDFDCPICKASSDTIIPGLKKDYIQTGKVKFIFKSLPLENLHPNAFHKTEAAFCAREQGGDKAFYSYYDSLFAKFGFSIDLDNELIALAQQNGLDPQKFKTCLNQHAYKERITGEVLEGNLIGSLGTPTWLIGKSKANGLSDTIKINGLVEYTSFQKVITGLLQDQQ